MQGELMPEPRSELIEFDLESLGSLPAGRQIQNLINRAIEDIERRPGDPGARTVSVVLKIKPKTRIESDSELGKSETILTGVGLSVTSNMTLPKYGPVEYDAGLNSRKILINPNCPGDHRQRMLPLLEGDVATVRMPASG
jgi:hypothetical protein